MCLWKRPAKTPPSFWAWRKKCSSLLEHGNGRANQRFVSGPDGFWYSGRHLKWNKKTAKKHCWRFNTHVCVCVFICACICEALNLHLPIAESWPAPSVTLWPLLSAAQHGHGRGRPLVQHLREVAELGQLPGPAHAGALRGEALQVHRVRAVLHHQREHAQVGAGGLHPQPGARRGLTESRVAFQPSCPKARGGPVLCGEASAGFVCLPVQSPVCQRCGSREPAIPRLGLWLMGESSGWPLASRSFFAEIRRWAAYQTQRNPRGLA